MEKKKIRDLTKDEIEKVCDDTICTTCPLYKICQGDVWDIITLVQQDELNVLLNQEVEIDV